MTLTSVIPLWALFGLLAALLSAGQMLVQEQLKAPALPMAFWTKVACALIMIPFVWSAGLPTNPVYYAMLTAQSLLWVISDVAFYRGINSSGAGVIARILPIATVVSFILWFAIDWQLAIQYATHPVHSAVLISIFCLIAFFAWNLKSCDVTRKALRTIWFVLFASVVGSVSTKLITQQADVSQGVFAYVFCEALIMIAMWLVYYTLKRPLPAAVMFGRSAMKAGFAAGSIAAFAVAATVYAVYHIDNPAYVGAVRYLDAVMILFFYRAIGRTNQGRVWAGLGIVACAAGLVIVKANS